MYMKRLNLIKSGFRENNLPIKGFVKNEKMTHTHKSKDVAFNH